MKISQDLRHYMSFFGKFSDHPFSCGPVAQYKLTFFFKKRAGDSFPPLIYIYICIYLFI